MSKPEYWLSYNNGAEKVRLPVPPPVVNVQSPFSNADINVVNGRDFTVIGDRGLLEFSFDTFIPRDYNPSYCDYVNIPKPQDFRHTIERWRNTKRPLRFLITGTNVNHAVTIREFSYDLERAGEPDDLYFSLSLKEYLFTSIGQQVDVTKPTANAGSTRPPVVNKGTAQTGSGGKHTVIKNDTLTKIAFDKYGKASEWRKIYDANKKTIGANPDKLKIGQKLVIPK